MAIRWLFFDLGSTLVDESLVYENRVKTLLAGSELDYQETRERLIEDYKNGLRGDLALAERLNKSLPKWTFQDEHLYPEVQSVLDCLSAQYHLGLIANQLSGLEERLVNFGIAQYFQVVISSAEIGFEKPALGIFQKALGMADCLPEQAVMIGDRLDNDIKPAKRLGMKTVRVMRGFGQYCPVTSENEQADATLSCLTELVDFLSDWEEK